ncbi:ABC transporter permease [Halovulum dunhuangense]|uniref:ABC transporter permease n=1 Tax=Halovulum dunhuangense TaxID=1505036 RepID=A0A849KZB9_9RHOB|nr:ABC transporter permease [Halovulum dunhuangense]NNU78904.1 ABC transporter permease [Halovulum dunhuangense]
MSKTLPRWADLILIPAINVLLAFFVAGLVVMFIGEDPVHAMGIMIRGALGSDYGIGYTLFYATSFICTGLAVAVAFHASIFNIGGEGQAGVAGIGVALVCLTLDQTHWLLTLPLAILGAMAFGAAWAAVPAYLQARRGSHIVITTIMFNYIASALLVYLLTNIFKMPGSMAPESRRFEDGANIPRLDQMADWIGLDMARSPANISLFVALIACVLVWLLIWRSRLGYEIRAFGFSDKAAVYAGISPFRITMITMLISGALAGLMAINTVMGDLQRLNLDSVLGAGFVGIAVALMGRSHPVGVVLAALLFGVLYQGGAELAFEIPAIPSQMILTIQALVILFTGSLENMVRFPMERLFLFINRGRA